MKYLLATLILTLTLALLLGRIYLPDNHISVQALLVTQLLIIAAGLLQYRSLLLVMLVLGLVAAVNFPAAILEGYHLSRNALLVTLAGVVLAPIVARLTGFK
jgi:hypothetical protein